MNPITPEGWPQSRIQIYAKNQPQYLQLPVAALGDENEMVVSVWELSWKERWLLFIGRPLRIAVMTFGTSLQPIRPHVEEDEYVAQHRKGWNDVEALGEDGQLRD